MILESGILAYRKPKKILEIGWEGKESQSMKLYKNLRKIIKFCQPLYVRNRPCCKYIKFTDLLIYSFYKEIRLLKYTTKQMVIVKTLFTFQNAFFTPKNIYA